MEARYTISNMQYENNSFVDRVRYLWKGRGRICKAIGRWEASHDQSIPIDALLHGAKNGRKFEIPPQNSVLENN